jgi:hypothetical protein
MKRILFMFAGSLMLGATTASYAKLPPPTPEEKAAAAVKAEKDAAGKAKAAKDLSEAQDKAVTIYRKARGVPAAAADAKPTAKPQSPAGATHSTGADHSRSRLPDAELTRREAQNQMPKPGQANDHSTTARDPQNSSGRK